jgi:DNA-binding transcriptional ArsR family regulator
MPLNKADLIIHPARLQILQALAAGPKSTAGLAERLVGMPKSSIYRHMRALLEGGMVEVTETRPVKGTLEKFYRLAQPAHLSQADFSGMSREDHLRYFVMFLAAQLQGFSDYLQISVDLDLLADRSGYSEASFYASSAELDQFLSALSRSIQEAVVNPPGAGRRRHKIAFITHPFHPGDNDNE